MEMNLNEDDGLPACEGQWVCKEHVKSNFFIAWATFKKFLKILSGHL